METSRITQKNYLGNYVLALEDQECVVVVEYWHDINYQLVGVGEVLAAHSINFAGVGTGILVEGSQGWGMLAGMNGQESIVGHTLVMNG